MTAPTVAAWVLWLAALALACGIGALLVQRPDDDAEYES